MRGFRSGPILFGLALMAACAQSPRPASTATAQPGARVAPTAVRAVNGKIAFTSNREGDAEIYTMNADGSGQTRLTDSPGFDAGPAWSPDGTKIAFTSDRNGDYEIYTMNADGSGQTRLTDSPAYDTDPAWSPDGKKIAFVRDTEIYTMNADGSG